MLDCCITIYEYECAPHKTMCAMLPLKERQDTLLWKLMKLHQLCIYIYKVALIPFDLFFSDQRKWDGQPERERGWWNCVEIYIVSCAFIVMRAMQAKREQNHCQWPIHSIRKNNQHPKPTDNTEFSLRSLVNIMYYIYFPHTDEKNRIAKWARRDNVLSYAIYLVAWNFVCVKARTRAYVTYIYANDYFRFAIFFFALCFHA